jgi:hypothetical protein
MGPLSSRRDAAGITGGRQNLSPQAVYYGTRIIIVTIFRYVPQAWNLVF